MEVQETDSSLELEQVEGELSRANLLRMRGQIDEAKSVCQKVLRAFPHESTALSLLGDLYAELGELESAERYYSLALDYNPGGPTELNKLSEIRLRQKEHRAAEAARKLGLTNDRSQVTILVVSAICFVIALGVLGYAMGSRMQQDSAVRPVNLTVDVGQKPKVNAESNVANANHATVHEPPANESPVSVPVPNLVTDDELVSKALRERAEIADELVSSIYDPRTGHAVVTISLAAAQTREQFADVTVRILNALPDVKSVSVRAIVKGEFVNIGDLERGSLEKIRANEVTASDALTNYWEKPITTE